ncbi:MAG: DUF370 domain-containing protein [Clostridia bacterium]|nr:DUF370 domain-containing protein [Clostridia bacterium]
MNLINIGYGNVVSADKLISVVSPDSAPIKRLMQQAKEMFKLVDGTCGRRTRAVLVFESGHIILSALMPDTITQRVEQMNGGKNA